MVDVSVQQRGTTRLSYLSKRSERLDINRCLEHQESVSWVVGIDLLTIGTKVSGAERTTIPLSDDIHLVHVAFDDGMFEVTKIRCGV